MYLTGYLTQAAPDECPKEMNLSNGNTVLRIPNDEVKTIFADTVAKWSANEGELEKGCDKAIAQIEKMQYARKLQIQGYQIILCYGAAFYAKSCLIKS